MKKITFITLVFLIAPALTGCQDKPPEDKLDTQIDVQKEPAKDVLSLEDKSQYNWSTMNEGPYKDKVSYATSNDLLNWTDSGVTLTEHASVPGAVYREGVIYLYFVDVAQDGIKEQVGVLKSEDQGKTWSDKILADIEGLGNKAAVDPDPFLMDSGQIRLYYFDINADRSPGTQGSANKIYSAVSNDGINFTEEEGVRFQKTGIYDPDVIKVGDTYRMYVGDMEGNTTYSATSSDGLTFTEEGPAYVGGTIPNVYYDSSQYYLYTGGIDIAFSQDGAKFTKSNYSFRSNIGHTTADPSVIQIADGSYILFFKFQEGDGSMPPPSPNN